MQWKGIEWFIDLLSKYKKSFDLFKYSFNNTSVDDNFSINTCIGDILDPGFLSFLMLKIEDWYIPSNITLEITEEYWPDWDISNIIKILKEVKGLWFKIAMDDYPKLFSDDFRRNMLLNNKLLTYLKIDWKQTKNLYSLYLSWISIEPYVEDLLRIKSNWVWIIFEHVENLNILKFLLDTFWFDIHLQGYYFKPWLV